jgi:hypothetical protein
MTRGQHRDAFVVEAVSGARFDVALERFLGGQAFEFREVSFAMTPSGTVVVGVDTSWPLANVTADTATADFEFGRRALHELVASAASFASAVEGRPIRYELIADYGNGSVLLCTLEGGRLTWSAGLPSDARAPSRNEESALPRQVMTATARWLSEMDDGLVALAKTARGLDPPVGPARAVAVSEVTDRIAHFRLAMASAILLSDLVNSDTHPLGTIERTVAQEIYLDVIRVATLPAVGDQRRALALDRRDASARLPTSGRRRRRLRVPQPGVFPMGRSSRPSSTRVDRETLSRSEMPLPNLGLWQTPPSRSLGRRR